MKSYDELLAERDALAAKLALIQSEWVKGNFSRKCISIAALIEAIESAPQQCLVKFNCGGTWLKDSNVNGGKRQGGAE